MTEPTREPALTVDRLRQEAEAGSIDTVLLAMADMQGRLQGKRCHVRYFLDEVLPPRRRGLQLPAGRGRRHEHGRRLRDVVLGPGLRRLRAAARPVDPAPGAVARGDRARALRRRVGGRDAGGGVPAPGAAPPARPARRAWAGGARRHRAGADRVQGHLRGGVGGRLPRPGAGQPVQRRLLAHRHRPGRAPAAPASATAWPAPACSSSRPRASATSASTRSRSATPRR